MNLTFKICTLNDLDELIKISKNTFIDAFETHNDPKDFEDYIASAFSKEKIQEELLNPNSIFYFVYHQETLVGYFKLNEGDAQNEKFSEESIELERIYVLQAYQGQQIGKRMLIEIIGICKRKQVSFLWLGVWEENKSAIRFYERYDFQKFGAHPYYVGTDKQTDWLMKLDF